MPGYTTRNIVVPVGGHAYTLRVLSDRQQFADPDGHGDRLHEARGVQLVGEGRGDSDGDVGAVGPLHAVDDHLRPVGRMAAKTVASSNLANAVARQLGEEVFEPRVGFKEFKPVIDRALVEALGLTTFFDMPLVAYGVGGQPQVGRGVTLDLTIGSLAVAGLRTAILDLGPLAEAAGLGAPLVLGQADLDGRVQVQSGLTEGTRIVVYSEKELSANSSTHVVDRIAKGRVRIGEEPADAWLALERLLIAVAEPKAKLLAS